MDNETKKMFILMKFPCGIEYKDFRGLQQSEIDALWDKHVKNYCPCTEISS